MNCIFYTITNYNSDSWCNFIYKILFIKTHHDLTLILFSFSTQHRPLAPARLVVHCRANMSYLFLPFILDPYCFFPPKFLPFYYQTDQIRLAQIPLPLVLSFSSSESRVYGFLFIVVYPVPSRLPVLKIMLNTYLLNGFMNSSWIILFVHCVPST